MKASINFAEKNDRALRVVSIAVCGLQEEGQQGVYRRAGNNYKGNENVLFVEKVGLHLHF